MSAHATKQQPAEREEVGAVRVSGWSGECDSGKETGGGKMVRGERGSVGEVRGGRDKSLQSGGRRGQGAGGMAYSGGGERRRRGTSGRSEGSASRRGRASERAWAVRAMPSTSTAVHARLCLRALVLDKNGGFAQRTASSQRSKRERQNELGKWCCYRRVAAGRCG
eukprot:3906736-Rhodomonas_salina.1